MPQQRRSLKQVNFTDCNLMDALFDRTNLEKANFATARHYRINPNTNNIKKAKFSLEGLPGLLSSYNIEVL